MSRGVRGEHLRAQKTLRLPPYRATPRVPKRRRFAYRHLNIERREIDRQRQIARTMSTTASALYAAEGAPSSDADACAPLPPPPPPPPRLTLAEANALPAADFRSAFANVVECCPEVAAALAQQRPFHSVAAVAAAAGALLDALPMAARRRVLLLHPDLAGRLAARGLLTAESQREQHAAGLLRLPPAQAQRLRALNASYRARFGFPFVACARGRSADSLLDDLAARLQREPHQELDAAMHEVKLICAMRLQELLSDE